MTNLEIAVVIAGALLGVGVLFMIFKKVDVSTGHSVVMGLAAALFCLPFIANLEWTGDGIKLQTKEVAKAVTMQIGQVAGSQATTGQGLIDLTAKLEATNIQLVELQNAVKDLQGGKVTAFTPEPVAEEAFKALVDKFTTAKETGLRTFQQAESLGKTLGSAQPAIQYYYQTPEQQMEFFKPAQQK